MGEECDFHGWPRLATILPGTVLYHHPDRIGTRLITNDKDTTTIEQETLPFGTLIAGNSPDPVNPIFTSYDRSAATGLDHAVNREFNPGRSFLQPDPIGMSSARVQSPQTLNLYSYVANDPVNRIDPVGLGDDLGSHGQLVFEAGPENNSDSTNSNSGSDQYDGGLGETIIVVGKRKKQGGSLGAGDLSSLGACGASS